MGPDERLSRLRAAVAAYETEDRYRHTLGVEDEAAALGTYLIPDRVEELRAAALLHDLTKCMTDAEQIRLAESLGIDLTDELRASPQVLHGLTAAREIPRLFPDWATESILHAVVVHTTGAPRMTLFDKIIFVADYTESGRRQEAPRRMRAYLWEHLPDAMDRVGFFDEVVRTILGDTIAFLQAKNCPIVSATRDAYASLTREIGAHEYE